MLCKKCEAKSNQMSTMLIVPNLLVACYQPTLENFPKRFPVSRGFGEHTLTMIQFRVLKSKNPIHLFWRKAKCLTRWVQWNGHGAREFSVPEPDFEFESELGEEYLPETLIY